MQKKSLKIVSVKSLGKQPVYDMSMPHEHLFSIPTTDVNKNIIASNCYAHSYAYSKIGYQTAYYKHYAKAPFLCSYLNQEISKKTPATAGYIEKIKKEILASGIAIRACDISQSGEGYTVTDRKTIVTGLNAVQGCGEAAQKAVRLNQPYTSFLDFLYRSPSAVNKTVIVALAKAGAFDCFNISRKWIHDTFTLEEGKLGKKLRDSVNKFGDKACKPDTEEATDPRTIDWSTFEYKIPTEGMNTEWELREILIAEKQVLGEFISGTADSVFKDFFVNPKNPIKKSSLAFEKQYAKVSIEGVILSNDQIPIKNGKNAGSFMGKITIESLRKEDFEITVFADAWKKLKDKLLPGLPARLICTVKDYNGEPSLSLESVEEIWKV